MTFLILAALSTFGAQIEKTFFVPNPLPAVDVRTYGSFAPEPGIVADRITYATEFGMRVPAIVYHPRAAAIKRPAIIIVNGHGGDKYSWYAYYAGILFARAGAVVLTYDPVGEGERNSARKSGTRQHDLYVPPDDNARRMAGLMMTDLRQATSYLAQRSDVDPTRIAAAGYSMGSFVVAIACAVEMRLRACVATSGGNLDGPGGVWDSSSKRMCQAIPYQSLAFLGDRGAVIYALNARRGAMLVHNGSSDDQVKSGAVFFADLRARTIATLDGEARTATEAPGVRNVFDYSVTADGGHRPYFVTRPVAAWLNEQLHFPTWTAIADRETKISAWAAATGAFMEPTYRDDHREGGTMALGADIPSIPHRQLNVLSDAEWERQKNDLILEQWFIRSAATSSDRR